MKGPWIGELVCDCEYKHRRITALDPDGDTVLLEGTDDEEFSYKECCHPANHEWEHPEVITPDGKHEYRYD